MLAPTDDPSRNFVSKNGLLQNVIVGDDYGVC